MSPIKGLTDEVQPGFPRIGKLRKGAPRPGDGKRPGKDLDHFRFTSDRPEVEEAFRQAYGDEPRSLEVFLPYATADENFPTWQEAWTAAGMQHRCDGETMVIWREGDHYVDARRTGIQKKCPGGCVRVGRLAVIPCLLLQAGYAGYVTLETHGIHDLLGIRASLLAAHRACGGRPNGLVGVRFTLHRVTEMVSMPTKDGGRTRGPKSLVRIEPAASWVRLMLVASERAALALPSPEPVVDPATGEVLDSVDAASRVLDEDEPEARGEPEAQDGDDGAPGGEGGPGRPWQDDPARAKAFKARAKALGLTAKEVLLALGVKRVGAFEHSWRVALDQLEDYAAWKAEQAGEEAATAAEASQDFDEAGGPAS